MSTPADNAPATPAEGGPVRRSNHSVRRIRSIAEITGAQSYLEIGVSKGLTFNALEFPRKVAVDPKFRFDVSEFAKPDVVFHEMTSNEYFVRIREEQPFDVIFLDGLHTFQQTFRDFCATRAVAHPGTVWLIDDVVPVDVYSAWPDHVEAIRARRAAGGASTAWHGDVFKVVFAIHDFFPTMSYHAIEGSGNAQAIVWQAPRESFAPAFDSLEAIERLTFFDLKRHSDLLRSLSEEEALARLAEIERR